MKIIIAILILLLLAISACSSDSVSTALSVDLKDSSISDGESTQLVINIKNTGEEQFEGIFKIKSDDSSAVKIEELPNDKKGFSLGPEEEITRLVQVTGNTNSLRTDYEITVDVNFLNGTKMSDASTVLSVRKD